MKRSEARRARDAALEAGARFYFGRPCSKYGHSGARRASNFACIECERLAERVRKPRADKQRERYRRGTKALAVLRELGVDI